MAWQPLRASATGSSSNPATRRGEGARGEGHCSAMQRLQRTSCSSLLAKRSSELDDYCKHCCSSLLALIGVVSPSARVFLDEPPKGFQWPSSRFRVRLRSAPLKDSLSDGMGIRLALAYRPTVALAAGATEIRVASVASRRVASRRTKSPWHESPASLRGTPRRAAHAALAYSCFVSHWDKVRLSLA